MKQLTLYLSALALVLFAACNNAEKPADSSASAAETFNLSAARDSIAAVNAAFGKAMSAGDSIGAAALYTSDAIIMSSNMPAVKGRDAIVAFSGETIRMGFKNFRLESTEVFGNADMLEEVGVYTLADDKGATIDKGKYIVLWKKEEGKWKLFRDIFNSDMPPAPMPEAPKK